MLFRLTMDDMDEKGIKNHFLDCKVLQDGGQYRLGPNTEQNRKRRCQCLTQEDLCVGDHFFDAGVNGSLDDDPSDVGQEPFAKPKGGLERLAGVDDAVD